MMTKEVICDKIKIEEDPLKMQIVNIECANEEELKNYKEAKACLVGAFLAVKIAREKFVRIIDLKGAYQVNREVNSDAN